MEPITLPGTLDALTPTARFVMDAAARAGLDKRTTYRLRLAVDEVVTNIVLHGYERSGQSGNVTVSAELDDDALRVCLEDTAPEFDPSDAPEPDPFDTPLEERATGGLGVYLAIRSVDEFRYERIDGRNRNVFTVYRPDGSRDSAT